MKNAPHKVIIDTIIANEKLRLLLRKMATDTSPVRAEDVAEALALAYFMKHKIRVLHRNYKKTQGAQA